MNDTEVITHFKNLLRINTVNPPGNELEAIRYLAEVLKKENIPHQIQETSSTRGNLVARLKGDGSALPLLLSSHVDVVPVESSFWKHDPFSATEDEGFLYGRGTIDMKNFTAMTLGVFIKAHREKWRLKRDLIFCAVSDEENGSDFGMKRLVEEKPDWVRAEYALGEVGAYTTWVGGKPIYPIQAGEKGVVWLELTFKGEAGHGSIPRPENAHYKLAHFLQKIESAAFPFHSTQTLKNFADGMFKAVGFPRNAIFQILKTPAAPKVLKEVVKRTKSSKAAALLAMVTNTVNPTGTKSGNKVNVVPSRSQLILDCRVIPGQTAQDLIQEIRQVTGAEFEFQILANKSGHEVSSDTPLFHLMKKHLEQAHPGATAVPWLTVGFTDAHHLSRLGVKCYGFTPVKLPLDIDFALLYHGHNERIPIEGFTWGCRVLESTVREFVCA